MISLSQLLLLLIGALGTVAWFFFTNKLKSQDSSVKDLRLDLQENERERKELEKKLNSIVINYLDRFKLLTELVNSGNKEINEAIHNSNERATERFNELRILIEKLKHID